MSATAIADLAASIYGANIGNYNRDVDRIRSAEYPLMSEQVYLDHAGATLHAKSLIDAVAKDLNSHMYGNPHSDHRPSKLASIRIEEVRRQTLRFFNADPKHFDLIFVANASAAIKLVTDCFRDGAAATKAGGCKNFWYGYHRDSHTSLVGVREATKGRHHCFSNDAEVEQWIMNPQKSRSARNGRSKDQLALFAYPGQSNMTGRRLPLEWPGKIRTMPHSNNLYTLLDAAALATTAPLDFSNPDLAPDFTCLSFYKIFGYPDLGGLVVRKQSGHALLHREIFCGGTVEMVISMGQTWHAKKAETLHDRLEDGTLPFHNIIALGLAIDTHISIYGSMRAISAHTSVLTRLVYDGLMNLRHFNGRSVAVVYNDVSATYGDPQTQGATIAFNLIASDGSLVGYSDVERLADTEHIAVRSGSLCNPGGFATYLHWSPWEMKTAYDNGHRCSHPTQILYGKPTGVVRVSLGAMSNVADVKSFLDFVRTHYVNKTSATLESAETVVASFDSIRDVDVHFKVGRIDSVYDKTVDRKKSQALRRLRSVLSLRGPQAETTPHPPSIDVI